MQARENRGETVTFQWLNWNDPGACATHKSATLTYFLPAGSERQVAETRSEVERDLATYRTFEQKRVFVRVRYSSAEVAPRMSELQTPSLDTVKYLLKETVLEFRLREGFYH